MIEQILPLARSNDPVTSFMAADRVHEFQADHCTRILKALKHMGQAGAEQIAALIDLDPYQVRKRLSELFKVGKVELTGGLRTTSTGRKERTWAAI